MKSFFAVFGGRKACPKLAVVLAGVILSGSTYAQAPQAAPVKIKVGYTISTDPSVLPLLYAVKSGEFKNAGLDVEAKAFAQSSLKYDTFKAGGIDVDVNMGAINAAQLHIAGVPVVVLRAVQTAEQWAIIVKNESPIKKPEELRGTRFAVTTFSGTNFGATYLSMKIFGIDFMRDMKVSTLPPSNLLAALEKDDVQAATLYEPYLSNAMKTGKYRILFRPSEVYKKQYNRDLIALTLGARSDFYQKNKAAMQKFVAVLERSNENLGKNVDEASEIMAKEIPELRMTPQQIKEIVVPYLGAYVREQNTPEFIAGMQKFYDELLEIKQLNKPVTASEFWVKP
ncbi:MAG: NMT1-like family protein [Noviherbaspirillum sp.]|nr:NMT1-like family protein [Noviherbaspirillum sp.]